MAVKCFLGSVNVIIENYLKLQGTSSNREWGQPVIYKSVQYISRRWTNNYNITWIPQCITKWYNSHAKCHAAKFPSIYEIESQFSESSSRLHLSQLENQPVFNMKRGSIFKEIHQKRCVHYWGMRNYLTSGTYIFQIYLHI